MKVYSANLFLLWIALASISFDQSTAAEDKITIFINNKIKEIESYYSINF